MGDAKPGPPVPPLRHRTFSDMPEYVRGGVSDVLRCGWYVSSGQSVVVVILSFLGGFGAAGLLSSTARAFAARPSGLAADRPTCGEEGSSAVSPICVHSVRT